MTVARTTLGDGRVVPKKEERKANFASSLDAVFEWYDFYLYAPLTPFSAAPFFAPGNKIAALQSAYATYAARFLIRPFSLSCQTRCKRRDRPVLPGAGSCAACTLMCSMRTVAGE
jgi:hypothetical protein